MELSSQKQWEMIYVSMNTVASAHEPIAQSRSLHDLR